MLDSFKSGFSSSGGKGHKQAEELHALIAAAQAERGALSDLLTQISARGSKLAQMGKTLDQVGRQAEAANASIEALSGKIASLDDRLKVADRVEQRLEQLMTQVAEAQKVTDRLTAPDGDLQKHRQAVHQLASQTLETQAAIDTLRKERGTLEQLRGALRQAGADVTQSLEGAAALKGELEVVRATATQLSEDHQRLRETSRTARADAAAATDAVKDIETKLDPLLQLQQLTQTTEERLAALNGLAEHVSHKTRALESQKHAIDHASVQTNRLNEMVWSMDVQINKLADGNKQVQRVEETLTRMEQLAADADSHLQTAMIAREDFSREFVRLDNESRALAEHLKQNVERLAVETREFDAFDLRLKALQSGIADAEGRMDHLLATDQVVSALSERIDRIRKNFQTLSTQADEIALKQSALDALGDRLAELDELGKRTVSQQATLLQSRADVDELRTDIHNIHQSHAEASRLCEGIARDRAALEAFGDRVTGLLAETPELDSRMDTVLGKLALVDEGSRSVTRLEELSAEIDGQLTRVSARVKFIDQLESRIDGLHVLTADVDRRFGEQLARSSELDAFKSALDAVALQVLDTHQRLDAVAAQQHKVLPLAAEVKVLAESVSRTQQLVASIQTDEAGLLDQKTQLADLVEQSGKLAEQVAQRLVQVQGVSDQLTRAGAVKDELVGELSLVRARQRDAISQTDAAEDQLKRAEAMVKQLERRRTQLAGSEQKITAFEARLDALQQHSDGLDQQIRTITERAALVQAVKAEVDHVHQISSRSKADLNVVTEQRTQVATLRTQIEDLLGRVTDTDQKIGAIDARRKMVEDVLARANAITRLLDDINVNLEMLGEQKAVIDHVGEQLARLDFTVREAQNTLAALQGEREVAERIEQRIKSLRAKSAPPSEPKTT